MSICRRAENAHLTRPRRTQNAHFMRKPLNLMNIPRPIIEGDGILLRSTGTEDLSFKLN